MQKFEKIVSWIKNKHDISLTWFIPKDEDLSSEKGTYYAHFFYMWLLAILLLPIYFVRYSAFEMTNLVLVISLASIFMIFIPLIYKNTVKLSILREFFICGLYVITLSKIFYFGGIIPSGTWLTALPVVAILSGGLTSAVIWLIINMLTILTVNSVWGNNIVYIEQAHPFWYQIYLENQTGLMFALAIFIILGEMSRRSAFRKLKKAHEQIHELAVRDALTGIYNRRHIWDEMINAERRAQQEKATFSVCLIDLDKFKNINDTYGHPIGDKVLKTVAKHMQSRIRVGDICARYGGEEFLCLLNNTNKESAYIFADNLRQTISELAIDDLKVSISVGIAQYEIGEDFSKTLARADGALYVAKANGRNRVVIS